MTHLPFSTSQSNCQSKGVTTVDTDLMTFEDMDAADESAYRAALALLED
jgi:hypothetical protein